MLIISHLFYFFYFSSFFDSTNLKPVKKNQRIMNKNIVRVGFCREQTRPSRFNSSVFANHRRYLS